VLTVEILWKVAPRQAKTASGDVSGGRFCW
jgi:hypothetical protein